MMCKKPWMRQQRGVSTKVVCLSDSARTACTPFPCGQCLHCRINKAREWSTRLLLEASVHSDSCFVTLTYEELPDPPSVSKAELQKFMKRFRKEISKYGFEKVRYFGVGEYGENSGRPHYHVAIFGWPVYDPRPVEKAWSEGGKSKGFVSVGEINKESVRYICGYCLKKLTNPDDPRLHDFDGEKQFSLAPEFMLSSRMFPGGMGAAAADQIAANMKESEHYDEEKEKIIRTINIGKKEFPIGRYLTERIAKKMGFDNDKFNAELWDYQQEIFNEYLDKGGDYYLNLVDSGKQKRLNQEKRQKIYKQKRVI